MRYIHKISIQELKNKYDLVAGWGSSPIELSERFAATDLKIDTIINGEESGIGDIICGIKIKGPKCFMDFTGSMCFILFTNLEMILLKQINELYPNADTIVGRLVDYGDNNFKFRSYSTDREDLIMLDLVKRLNFPKNFMYMDIGVCHPVVRNNTYLLYENGYLNGVMIEPNPEMANLVYSYRKDNKLIRAGAGTAEGKLVYVKRRDGKRPGFNHFKRDVEDVDTSFYDMEEVPVYDINCILDEICDSTPLLLDIDTEGMDYSILEHMDMGRHKIKIVCVEKDGQKKIYYLLASRGYVHYAETKENYIFIHEAEYEKLMNQDNRVSNYI